MALELGLRQELVMGLRLLSRILAVVCKDVGVFPLYIHLRVKNEAYLDIVGAHSPLTSTLNIISHDLFLAVPYPTIISYYKDPTVEFQVVATSPPNASIFLRELQIVASQKGIAVSGLEMQLHFLPKGVYWYQNETDGKIIIDSKNPSDELLTKALTIYETQLTGAQFFVIFGSNPTTSPGHTLKTKQKALEREASTSKKSSKSAGVSSLASALAMAMVTSSGHSPKE